MKRLIKTFLLSFFATLMVGLLLLAFWQRENLKAVYTFLTQDGDTIVQNMETDRQEQHDQLKQDYNITVTPPTTQQTNDLLDGKVTPEEVKDTLGITEKLPPKTEEPAPDPQPPASSIQPEMTEEERQQKIQALVDQCVAELYACQVELMAQLGVMKQEALDIWNNLAPEERTQSKLYSFGMEGLSKCYDLEVETDRQVKDILARCRAPLEELKGDTAVLDQLWKHYCEEKAAEKAYYLNKYLN